MNRPALPYRRTLQACALGILMATGAVRSAAAPATPESVLSGFRDSIWADPVYIEFVLREMPKHGTEKDFRGKLWGSRSASGPLTRIDLDLGAGGYTHRFLVLGGPDPQVWTSEGPGPGSPNPSAVLSPVAPGSQLTVFDIQMPYLYWLDSQPGGTEDIRGRRAYGYLFAPPADFPKKPRDSIRVVRVYLDIQYNALLQAEVAGSDGRVARTLSLLELKKVGDHWIPRDVDVRGELTRDKTRLSVTGAALGVAPGPEVFDPNLLGDPEPPAPAGRFTRIEQ